MKYFICFVVGIIFSLLLTGNMLGQLKGYEDFEPIYRNIACKDTELFEKEIRANIDNLTALKSVNHEIDYIVKTIIQNKCFEKEPKSQTMR